MNKPNKPTYEELEIELAEARAYADKLAAGLPDGMLPKDVENLREANLALATELAIMTEDRDSETRWAKEYFDNWQSVNKQLDKWKTAADNGSGCDTPEGLAAFIISAGDC